MSKHRLLFFITFLYRAFVRADYTIDDSNYSILKFSENPAGPVWGPFGSDTGEVLEIRLPNGTMQTIDATQCYDGTYTYAACTTSSNCEVQFSFTGSGITIYVLQAGPQGMSASLSIDSGAATTATLSAPPAPQYYIPHVTLFNVQNIPSGTHTAVMTVLDWNGGISGMMLDYINVNQAVVANPSTTSSPTSSPTTPASTQSSSTTSSTSASLRTTSQQTSSTGTQTTSGASSVVPIESLLSSQSSGVTTLPSSTPSGNGIDTSSSTSKRTNVAAIAGGAAGGAVGLLALFGLAFCYFRRRRRQHLQTLNERPSPLLLPQPDARFASPDSIGADPFASSSALSAWRPSGTSRPLQSWTESEAGFTPNSGGLDSSGSSPTVNVSHTRIASSDNNSAASPMPVSIGAAIAATTHQYRDASTPTQLVQPAVGLMPVVSYPNEKSRSAFGGGTALQQASIGSIDLSSTGSNAILTDGQADFVNSLFNNNVPAPVVARVLERMLANPQGASTTGVDDPELRAHVDRGSLFTSQQTQLPAGVVPWRSAMSDIGDGGTMMGTAPPSYDYARAS